MKKICDYYLKNRFLISMILVIVFTIVGYLFQIKNFTLVEWITNTNHYFSFWMNLKFFGLILAGYELLQIVTGENQNISLWGSIAIAFSSAVAYNLEKIDALLFGFIILIALNKMLLEKSKKMSVFYGILIFLFSIFYSYSFIPYAVSFAFVFLGMYLYLILKNRYLFKNDKFKIRLLVISTCFSIAGMVISKFVVKNEYVENMNIKIDGFNLMFSYLYNLFLPFKNIQGKELLASIIGLSPFPIIISLFYIYKNEKNLEFLMPMTVIGVLQTVFCLSGFPNIIEKWLLLDGVSSARMMTALQLTNLLIIFYFLGNIHDKLFSTKVAIRITIVFLIVLVFVNFPQEISNRIYLTIFVMEQTLFSFLFLNVEEYRYRKVFMFFLVIFTLMSGLPVYFIG